MPVAQQKGRLDASYEHPHNFPSQCYIHCMLEVPLESLHCHRFLCESGAYDHAPPAPHCMSHFGALRIAKHLQEMYVWRSNSCCPWQVSMFAQTASEFNIGNTNTYEYHRYHAIGIPQIMVALLIH